MCDNEYLWFFHFIPYIMTKMLHKSWFSTRIYMKMAMTWLVGITTYA